MINAPENKHLKGMCTSPAVYVLPRSVRRPKLSPSDEKNLVRIFRNNPGTTKAQACKKLETGRRGYVLKFAAAHIAKPNAFWEKVLCSDDTEFEMPQ
uniref:Uncharacterized protein n=1 Tax=Pundamilia nyererei TaxID=303518 RepID=A0A3B4EYM3_9CICH